LSFFFISFLSDCLGVPRRLVDKGEDLHHVKKNADNASVDMPKRIGLLAISSCAIGLLIAMVLVSKDSALVTSRIQTITVTDVGRFS
jgi:hypothetical protein